MSTIETALVNGVIVTLLLFGIARYKRGHAYGNRLVVMGYFVAALAVFVATYLLVDLVLP